MEKKAKGHILFLAVDRHYNTTKNDISRLVTNMYRIYIVDELKRDYFNWSKRADEKKISKNALSLKDIFRKRECD